MGVVNLAICAVVISTFLSDFFASHPEYIPFLPTINNTSTPEPVIAAIQAQIANYSLTTILLVLFALKVGIEDSGFMITKGIMILGLFALAGMNLEQSISQVQYLASFKL